jgi:FAD/FMN-containing dehydrogenase/Fe-S oxidoreductase
VSVKPQYLWDDLRGSLHGTLLTEEVSRRLYSTDASIFQIQPTAVVIPQDEDDVLTTVRFAMENRLPLTARGAGSGLAGESLGPGIALDFTKHFRRILTIGADTVQVQPGVVCKHLNDALAKVGRRFAPDTASESYCTVGGMWATNASGARVLKYGYTRDHVLSLRTVLTDGTIHEFGLEPLPGEAPPATAQQELVAALDRLLVQHQELIDACQPRTRFNRCGYLLHDLKTPVGLNLPKLLVGSEGTLGLFTAATLKTVPLPVDRGVVLFGFPTLDAAARAVLHCLPFRPSACELVERRLLSLACEVDRRYEQVISPAVQAVLLVEFEGDAPGTARKMAEALYHQLRQTAEVSFTVAVVGQNATECDWLWRIRDLALPSLYNMGGRVQPVPFIEDVGIPVEQLPYYLFRVQEILRKHHVTSSFLIHAGSGQVHTRPFLELHRPEQVETLRQLAQEIYPLVLDLGGTISTQHGVGLARTPWVRHQYGRLVQVFHEIKTLFDPLHLLNPGKIAGQGSGDPLANHLRSFPKERQSLQVLPLVPKVEEARPSNPVIAPEANGTQAALPAEIQWRLQWKPGEVEAQCQSCNGCGHCRTEQAALRMCPIFRADPEEAASPRAKANLLRQILAAENVAEQLAGEELREVADLCVNCKMCGLECPAKVKIPKLMLETKAQHMEEHGLSWEDWVLARTENFASFGSAFAWLVNPALESRTFRWVLQKFLGLSRRRKLPRFASQSFLRRAERKGWTRKPHGSRRPRVAYFVDVYANYNDPEIAEATVAVLQHNGIETYVPRGQTGCGIAPLAYGDVAAARRMAERNLNILADLAREGFTIICSEPTAALMLRQDYRDLVDDPDTELVARQTTELTTYLWRLHLAGKLRTDFQPLPCSVGHHVPCHQKALQLDIAGPKLLGLIPELRPHTIDLSCSGMAGTFGLKERNFALSLRAGQPMLERLRSPSLHYGSSECSSCRMQMEHGASKRSLHPVLYLALAYGLMPQIARRLRP